LGIVIRQSLKNTISTYIGFGVGAINTLFLYTNFLTDTYYGLVAFILSTANILMPFMAFGVHNGIVKFYSSFKTKKSLNSFLTLMLFLPLVLVVPLGLVTHFAYETIAQLLATENPIIRDYLWHIYIIAIAMAYFEIFFAWTKVQLKTVFGTVMREIFHRVCISILLIAVYFEFISVEDFIIGVTLVYLARMGIMKLYAYSVRFPKFTFGNINGLSDILKYCFLIILAGSVAMLILDIDKFMLGQYLKIENVAYYSVAIFIATVIAVPHRAMHQILLPLTAKYLNDNNKKDLKDLYVRSSLNLLVISGLIFLLIILNINALYQIIPKEFSGGLFVVIIISVAKLYDNSLGSNNAILFNSDYYRVVLFFGVLLAVLTVILNVIFIPIYGINGSAFATFLAIVIYNTAKVLFVKKKFNILPYSKATYKVLLLIMVLNSLYFVDISINPFLSIALKSLTITVIYVVLIYRLNISKDISEQIEKYMFFFKRV